MPRSAADRRFGFKAKGLVRILTAADPAEILIALDELGLVIQQPSTLFQEFGRLVADFLTAPFAEFINQFEQAIPIIERAIFELLEDPAPGEAESASELSTLIADLQAQADRVQAQRRLFRERLEALEKQTEEDIAITFL